MAGKPQAQVSELQLDALTRSMKDALNEQPKKNIRIPLSAEIRRKLTAEKEAGKTPKWPATIVGVNGHNIEIPHGEDFEVPEEVANILREAGLLG